MEELKKQNEAPETAPEIQGKTVFRRIVKGLLWFAGVWIVLLLALQVILSPSVLGRLVDRYAPEYIDGDLKFEKIGVNMFRHFPNVGITMENGSLTYPADRFDSHESKSVQGLLLYHGNGETADTLASFRHFSAGIDIAALLAGRISISHLIMEQPRIFAHAYDSETANWDIFRFGESEDTSSTSLPPLSIGRVRLTDHPHIVYTASEDTLFSIIDVKQILFDGRLDSKKASKNRIGLTFDSLVVAGRMAADTIGLRMDRLHMHEHHDHMDIHASAKALLATRTFGRIHIPMNIEGTAKMPKDTVPAIEMNGFRAEIAAVPIKFDMALRKAGGGIGIKGRFDIENCKAEDIIDGFIKNIIPETKKIRTDASFSLSGTCEGIVGGGQLPAFEAVLTVPESSVSHNELEHEISLALGASVRTDEEKRINVSIDRASVGTYGLRLNASGKVSDVLGADPFVEMDGKFRASADSLLTFLPDDSGIIAKGELRAELKGGIRLSQMDIYNFGQADLTGSVSSDELVIRSPEDTIDVLIKGMDLGIGPESKTSTVDPTQTFRLLGISGSVEEADISLKDAFTLKSRLLSFSAKNSVDAMAAGKGSKKVHPLGGQLKAVEIVVEDSEGMSLTLDNTSNGFQMVPKEDNQEIPVLSLTSSNKRIYLRDDINRLILTDADIKAGAVMNSLERRQRRRVNMDSLALAHPGASGASRDSLESLVRSRRRTRVVPEWMTEEDFRSGDLNFSLDGIVAEYFRKWEMNGGIAARTGVIMTPKLPLRNIIRGMDMSFNNNEVKIDSFKVRSGKSEIGLKGTLSGLRRALLGRGTYKLEAVLSTDKMDAAEMLAAFNAGATADLSDTKKLAEASDSEFMEMIIADSLEAGGLNTLLIVPADLNAEIKVDASNVKFSDLMIDEFTADIIMKERCMQIADSDASTNMGRVHFDGFYATRTKKDIQTGFNLDFTDVTSEKVIAMMPAIDTIMPLLKSFKGQIDCNIAATADLDTCMNIMTPSINGVIRIEGEDLTMSDNEVFRELAQKLKFRNRSRAKIDRMTVEGLIKDNTLEVFPFVLELDRYTLALSGLQNLDMSYRYHASIIRSPIVFKVGVDIYGQDFDNMKFKIGKPKYRSTNIPVFTSVIDETRINLAESIRNIFEKGVEIAVRENEMQTAINEHKEKIGYVNAAEQSIEELTAEEQKQLEEESLKAEAQVQIDSTSLANTLETIISNNE